MHERFILQKPQIRLAKSVLTAYSIESLLSAAIKVMFDTLSNTLPANIDQCPGCEGFVL